MRKETNQVESVTPIQDAKWRNEATNSFSIFFSEEVMLTAYVPIKKREKPYVQLFAYKRTSTGYEFTELLLYRTLPDERDETSIKKNALEIATKYMQQTATRALQIAEILKNMEV